MSRGNKRNKKKPPKNVDFPIPTKEAKYVKNPIGYQSQYIAWHFQCMDIDGDWPCTMDIISQIKNKLHEYERLRWSEVLKPINNHPMPINKIINKAQRRLLDLGYGDTAKLYQLQIKNGGSMQRLWGLRQENIFQILWWDPNHEIYPVEKRNT